MTTEAAFRNIRLDVSESIATITVDRPSVRNALNLETVNELIGPWTRLPSTTPLAC